jgi:hypothetical protein
MGLRVAFLQKETRPRKGTRVVGFYGQSFRSEHQVTGVFIGMKNRRDWPSAYGVRDRHGIVWLCHRLVGYRPNVGTKVMRAR